MENEYEDKRIVKIVTITLASMFLCVVLLILVFVIVPNFFNGSGRKFKPFLFPEGKIAMTKRVLWEKYGEEFIVHDVYSKASHEYFADCSPVSNEEIAFRAAVWKDGSGVVYDEYMQSILEREFKIEMEEELKKYHDNVFVRVGVPYGADDDTRYGDINVQDITMEEYVKRADLLWCRIEIGVDVEEGSDYLEEEYAFYESLREKISNQKIPPRLNVVYYNMDAELQEWCRDYFTQNGVAYGTYTSKLGKGMAFECTAEGVNITYDEFKTMREELGKDE